MTDPTTPPEDALPFNQGVTTELQPGERAVVRFTPDVPQSTFHLASLGISKAPETTYQVSADGGTVYEQSAVPPTDIDDMVETFKPPVRFDQTLTVTVRNTSSKTTRRYGIQPLGWEI